MTTPFIPPTDDEILAALSALGETPDDVADSLRAKQIRGGSSSNTCPIARYVRRTFAVPDRVVIAAGPFKLRIQAFSEENERGQVTDRAATYVTHPEPVRQFISRFDGYATEASMLRTHRYYPDLLDPTLHDRLDA
jgi:hypothetical protein